MNTLPRGYALTAGRALLKMQRASVALAPWVIQGMSHAPVKNFGGMKMNSQNGSDQATASE